MEPSAELDAGVQAYFLSHVATTLIWFDTKSLERPFPFHVTSNTGLDRAVIGHLSARLLASPVCPHSHLLVGQNSYLALLAIVSTDGLIKQVHKTTQCSATEGDSLVQTQVSCCAF